jgi:glucosamine kinase
MDEIIVLGIDGGGTSTRAVLATGNGTILGFGRAGSSNYDDVGVEASQENIRLAVEQAWLQAGRAPRPADAAFLGLAGVVSDADRAIISRISSNLALAAAGFTSIDHDIRIALAGGLALKPGIVLIVGTGSSCYGRRADGSSCRVGGWGHLLDDGGSSYYLGLEAIRAVVRSVDGRLGSSSLVGHILSALDVQDEQEIMHRLYHPQMPRAEIAGLAPLVLKAAQQGDALAQKIVKDGQNELAQLVEVAAHRLKFEPDDLHVTMTGGLAHSGDYFKRGIYAAIYTRLPGAHIQEPLLAPVLGAALLAIQLLGISLTPEVISTFQQNGIEPQ